MLDFEYFNDNPRQIYHQIIGENALPHINHIATKPLPKINVFFEINISKKISVYGINPIKPVAVNALAGITVIL